MEKLSLQTAKKVQAVRAALSATGGAICNVTYIKKDGSEAVMACRMSVTSHLKGGKATTRTAYGQTVVYKMNGKKSGYRSFYAQNVKAIKCGALQVNFD